MRSWSAALLCALLFLSILTSWLPARWPVSILEVGSFVLALAWIAKLALSNERPKLSPMLAPLAFVALFGMVQISLHWTVAAPETTRMILAWSAYLALGFAALQIFDLSARIELFLRYLLVFGLAICILSTLQAFTSPGAVFWMFPVPEPVYVMGPFLYHTHYANLMELTLPLALVPALTDRTKRLRYCLMAGAMIASVIVSASRGGFVLICVETVVVVAISGRRQRLAVLTGVIVLAGALTAIVGWDALASRFHLQNADIGRLDMLNASLDMIRDHPWTGVGLGSWPTAYPFYAHYDDGLFANQAHSDWAQWTAEGGFLVLAAMLLLLAWTVHQARRCVWCVGPLFVFIHAFFDYPFQKPQIAALVFTMLAASAVPGNRVATHRREDKADITR